MKNDDLFNNYAFQTAVYISKLESGHFDNDANNPNNATFVKHGDSKFKKGVDRSYIDGSEIVQEYSQTFINYTPDENFDEDVCDCLEESGTWYVPHARDDNPDQLDRAVIVSLSHIN